MRKVKLLLTGGHAHATAYALIKDIKSSKSDWELLWIGPKSHVEGKKVESLENKIFENMGVKVFNIDAGRVQRKFTMWTIPSLLKIPLGIIEGIVILIKERPNIVLSFGGFVGFAVVVAAWILRIPIIIHEQTIAAGRANIYSSNFANKIALARKDSENYFPKDKTSITGNPIDRDILKIKPKIQIGNPPIIFVTGGHTGSSLINKNIAAIASELLKEFEVIHQTGKLDYRNVYKIKNDLPKELSKNYKVVETIDSGEWPQVLTKSDIIVSRAGANIVSQVLSIKRPAIFIPISISYKNEQLLNAKYAEDFGIAEVLEEKDLKPETLLSKINFIRTNWKKILSNAQNKKNLDEEATSRLIKIINEIV